MPISSASSNSSAASLLCTFTPRVDVGTLRLSGADVRVFLQGQLTNDVQKLTPQQAQLSGFCNIKGRLLASFNLIMPNDSDIYMQMPVDLCTAIAKRLKMFVLRSQVQIEDISQQYTSMVFMGEDAVKALAALQLPAPNAAYSCQTLGAYTVMRLAGDAPRFEVIGENQAMHSLLLSIQTLGLAQASLAHWLHGEIMAGTPMVLAETSDQFVPQTIDFDVAGGVSFKKGCYTGQEIVARVHYLGRIKSRLFRAQCTDLPSAGEAIYGANNDQPIGKIVYAAQIPNQPTLALLSLQLDYDAQNLVYWRDSHQQTRALTAIARVNP